MIDLGPDLRPVARATVVGLARSGIAAATALLERGVRVIATDARRADAIGPLPSHACVQYALGGHPAGVLDGSDVVVISPGVRLDAPLLLEAAARGIPVIPEVELASRLLEGHVIGITGTNGKSTTTELCAALLRAAGRAAVACGNLGVPWSAYATAAEASVRATSPVWVVEMSSFQLEATRRLAPDVAIHLNLTPDHLDRHGSLAAYGAAKARIFAHQRPDQIAIVNDDDDSVRAIGVLARRVPFSARNPATHAGALAHLGLEGVHNRENALAALLATEPFGVTDEAARRAFRAFRPLPHRLGLVRVVRGVSYYNDSKGTNVDATLKSLEGMPDRRVVLILGGRKKDDGFARLAPVVARKARCICAIGEAGPAIEHALGAEVRVVRTDTLERAVDVAREVATEGDVVLLSPACASFDQFRNFEHRGEVFEGLVQSIEESRA